LPEFSPNPANIFRPAYKDSPARHRPVETLFGTLALAQALQGSHRPRIFSNNKESTMARIVSQAAIAAVMLTAAWIATTGEASAQYYGPPGWVSPEPNYYAMPTGADGLTAAMYPSPRPTPPLIGQTYITYGPLSPQEFLYVHHRFYRTQGADGQTTRTSVTWGHHPTLWPFHPSLTSSVPALRTPASSCRF
jgi:hypothetical protein